jgi:lysyl-tRNA synthetase class 2
VRDSLVKYAGLSEAEADSAEAVHAKLKLGEEPPKHWGLAQLQFGLFEAAVEEKLWQPTFIIDYPVEVSPLARASDANPAITERFELFITGREFGNGFSELNDAEDQAARFQAQVANKEPATTRPCTTTPTSSARWNTACPRPAAAASASTLMMLLTDSPSIRDVILFPALRRA